MSDEIGHADDAQGAAIEDYLAELRTFPPPEDFARAALVRDRTLYEQAERDPEGFWAEQARALTWFEPWEQVLDWQLPFAKWFVGGRLNVAFNCLDRHVEAGAGDRVAFHFEGEPGDRRTITYAELLEEVGRSRERAAQSRRRAGRPRGDLHAHDPRACRWRCWRAPESGRRTRSCSAASRPTRSRDRIDDAAARLLITADGGWRAGSRRR